MAVIYELLQLISKQYIFSVPFSSWTRSRCVDWVWAGLSLITQSVNIPTVLQLLFATWFLRSLYRLISYVLVARSLTLNNATFAHCIRFITSMCQPSWYETQSILIENWSTFCKLRKFSRMAQRLSTTIIKVGAHFIRKASAIPANNRLFTECQIKIYFGPLFQPELEWHPNDGGVKRWS